MLETCCFLAFGSMSSMDYELADDQVEHHFSLDRATPSWPTIDLWCNIMSLMAHPGPLILANKYFHSQVMSQWKKDPLLVAEYLVRASDKFFVYVQQHPLFNRCALDMQMAILHYYIRGGGEVVGPVNWAAINGHTTFVKTTLGKLASANDVSTLQNIFGTHDFQGYTPFTNACRFGHRDIVEILLNHGQAVEGDRPRSMGTPLCCACRSGHEDVVQLLLERGAAVHPDRTVFCTPMHVACEKSSPRIVRLLIDAGADVNRRWKGLTPLHVASSYAKVDIVKLLLERGALVNEREPRSATALHLACEVDPRRLDILFDGQGQMQRQHLVEVLLSHGADVNVSNYRHRTPLHYACIYGARGIVQLLCHHQADVNALDDHHWDDFGQDTRGATPLHYACRYGHRGLVELLLHCGADVDLQDRSGDTVFHYACRNGDTDMVQLLLEHGANPAVTNSRKETAMHYACSKGRKEVVCLLLSHGFDAAQVDEKGVSPLHIACQVGHTGLVEMLLQSNAGAVNAVDCLANTPLHYACKQGARDVVAALLERGADVRARNWQGTTALELAYVEQHMDVFALLWHVATTSSHVVMSTSCQPK